MDIFTTLIMLAMLALEMLGLMSLLGLIGVLIFNTLTRPVARPVQCEPTPRSPATGQNWPLRPSTGQNWHPQEMIDGTRETYEGEEYDKMDEDLRLDEWHRENMRRNQR